MATLPSERPLDVTIIGRNRASVAALRAYFTGVGVASRAISTLSDSPSVPAAATAVVIFPDEFEVEAVVARVGALRAARAQLLIVVVSSAPHRFRSALEPDGKSPAPLALPKPAFGWTILDAIRAHAHAESP